MAGEDVRRQQEEIERNHRMEEETGNVCRESMNSSCKKTGNVKENMKNTSERYHRRRWKESILLILNLGFVAASASWHRKARPYLLLSMMRGFDISPTCRAATHRNYSREKHVGEHRLCRSEPGQRHQPDADPRGAHAAGRGRDCAAARQRLIQPLANHRQRALRAGAVVFPADERKSVGAGLAEAAEHA